MNADPRRRYTRQLVNEFAALGKYLRWHARIVGRRAVLETHYVGKSEQVRSLHATSAALLAVENRMRELEPTFVQVGGAEPDFVSATASARLALLRVREMAESAHDAETLSTCEAIDGCLRSDLEAWAVRNLEHAAKAWIIPSIPGRHTGDTAPPRASRRLDPPFETDRDICRILHGMMFSIELCAADYCAAMVSVYADSAPAAALTDLSRQAVDEMRHYFQIESLLNEFGAEAGDYPWDIYVWSKFLIGAEFAEHLCIEQRLGEGNGLDGGLGLLQFFETVGHDRACAIFELINADEERHVRTGNDWLMRLCGSQTAVAALDEKVRQQLEAADMAVRHFPPINRSARARAGFSDAEIDLVEQRAAAAART